MNKYARHIPHVDVVALEVPFKYHHGPVRDSPMHKVVDQQVNPHPRRHAEDRCQAEADAIFALQDGFLRLHFRHAVERDRPERRFFRAVLALFTDPIAAIGHRHDDALGWRSQPAEHGHGLEVGCPGRHRVAVAQRRPHERCQRDDHVGLGYQLRHQGLVPAIAPHHLEARVRAAIGEGVLPEEEVVHHRHLMAKSQQGRGQHRAEIARAACNQNLHIKGIIGNGG